MAKKLGEGSTREQYKKSIKYLANNINVMRTKFYKEGYGDIYDNKLLTLSNKYSHKAELMVDRSGNLSKSMKEYDKLNDRELKDYYNMLFNLRHHEIHGNVSKYRGYIKKKNERMDNAISRVTGDKYDNITDKEREELYKRLEEYRKSGKILSSEQVILEYMKEIRDDEDEVIENAIRRREDAMSRLSKYKISNLKR